MFDDFDDQIGDVEESFGGFTPEEPEGLLPPRESTLCLGHENIENTLVDFINSGAMPHALIFAGQKGIGKSTMAFRLARYLFKNSPVDIMQDSFFGDASTAVTSLDVPTDDPIFARVISGGYSDLLTIERQMDVKKGVQKDSVDVETARKVTPFLRMTSSDGGWRVVIIDDADTMNRNAQNAMLKILEEPPKNTLLILITHRLGAMIPTIRSRCRVLNFDPLNADDLATLMQKEVGASLSAVDQKLLSALSSGSIGEAQTIISSNGLETAQSVFDILKEWPKFNWVNIHSLADQAGRLGQNNSFVMIEKTFLTLIENFVFAMAGKEIYDDLVPNQQAILQSKTLEHWLLIWDELKNHFRQARHSNLDKRQAVLEAFNILMAE